MINISSNRLSHHAKDTIRYIMAVSLLTMIGSLGCAGHNVIYLENTGNGLIYGPMKTHEKSFGQSISYYILSAENVTAKRIQQKQWLAQPQETCFKINATGEEAFEVIRQLLSDHDKQIMQVDISEVPFDRLEERVTLCFTGGNLSDVIRLIGQGLRLNCYFSGEGVIYFFDPVLRRRETEK